MAFTQLDLYNDALLLLGQRALSSLTEDQESRYRLDGAYNRQAIRYCLELTKPQFATKTLTLAAPAAGTTFDYTHSLPTEFVTMGREWVFSDTKLDQPISRYVIEGRTIQTDYATIYVRCVSDAYALADWDASFGRVMGAYLALETATRLSTDDYGKIVETFTNRVQSVRELESLKVPADRSAATTVTLTNAWRHVYNDALLLMGLEEITSNTDDSNRRSKLDRALDAGLVADLLEDTGWQFGKISTQIDFDPSAEPAWGYTRAIPKPTDMHRLDGVWTDEYMRSPLKRYSDEGDYWFSDYDTVYISYVSTDFLVNPSNWPVYFKRLVAARMAKDAAPSLVKTEGADFENANMVYEERKASAMSNDVMQSPPRLLTTGNWVGSRQRGNYRGRP